MFPFQNNPISIPLCCICPFPFWGNLPQTPDVQQLHTSSIFFFFLNHCYSLQTPSKPNRHESLHTFYNCHVSIVRMAPEHHERSKALAHPELFLLGAAKGAQNLTWVPRPFAYTAGFLRVSRWCIQLHQSLCCHTAGVQVTCRWWWFFFLVLVDSANQ